MAGREGVEPSGEVYTPFPPSRRGAFNTSAPPPPRPGAPPVDDASDGQHSITWLSPGVPAFTVESTHHEYRLTKEFVSDSEENAMIISGTFTPELPDVRLFMQASAHWSPGTEGNFGEVLDTHPPALLMRQQDVW